MRGAGRPLPHYDIAAGIIWHDGHILIARRPPHSSLGGLWEFPGGKREPGESLEGCLVREVREELDIEVRVGRLLKRVRHSYASFRITLHAYHCRYVSGEPQTIDCTAWRWVTPQELGDHTFPAANRAIIAALEGIDPAQGRTD